jgi:hypothetical protein
MAKYVRTGGNYWYKASESTMDLVKDTGTTFKDL